MRFIRAIGRVLRTIFRRPVDYGPAAGRAHHDHAVGRTGMDWFP